MLGTVLLLFSFAMTAGAALAWLLAVASRFVHPERPQRLAVAMALRRLAEALEAFASGDVQRQTRHGATVAVLHAYQSLGSPPPARTRSAGSDPDEVSLRLTDLSWTPLIGSARCAPGAPAPRRPRTCAGRPPSSPTGAAELAATEKRAHVLLDRLRRHRQGAAPAVSSSTVQPTRNAGQDGIFLHCPRARVHAQTASHDPSSAVHRMTRSLVRRVAAEAVGTGLLVVVAVGSGIQATRLSQDAGVRLPACSLAAVFGLGVLITLLGPVSGGHLNPAVTLSA
ncbi:aquaporin [Streptomyces sp. NPDC058755]|uniref:aquaporin n=1 Tax=Streptomyces sp. NPDC058755 TaxID=3346624 RepID=UPI003693E97D